VLDDAHDRGSLDDHDDGPALHHHDDDGPVPVHHDDDGPASVHYHDDGAQAGLAGHRHQACRGRLTTDDTYDERSDD
jgi:hypothetical protein